MAPVSKTSPLEDEPAGSGGAIGGTTAPALSGSPACSICGAPAAASATAKAALSVSFDDIGGGSGGGAPTPLPLDDAGVLPSDTSSGSVVFVSASSVSTIVCSSTMSVVSLLGGGGASSGRASRNTDVPGTPSPSGSSVSVTTACETNARSAENEPLSSVSDGSSFASGGGGGGGDAPSELSRPVDECPDGSQKFELNRALKLLLNDAIDELNLVFICLKLVLADPKDIVATAGRATCDAGAVASERRSNTWSNRTRQSLMNECHDEKWLPPKPVPCASAGAAGWNATNTNKKAASHPVRKTVLLLIRIIF